jgi:acetyl-CoA carboxylase biotin carboxyl carrier protein
MARIHIVTEVTGKVWLIEAAAGRTVAADETIMIIESMKMEIPVGSATAGQVVEILVAEGDAVQEGQVVAIVET